MLESVGALAVAAVVVYLMVLSARRRANMTPQERETADLKREVRALKREQRRQRYD